MKPCNPPKRPSEVPETPPDAKISARKLSGIKATLDAWAVELGKERRTLARILTRNEIEVEAGKLYRAHEIFNGILGSEHAAKVKNLELDAEKKEREGEEARRELVRMAEVEQ